MTPTKEPALFKFYLDAWMYTVKAGLPLHAIKRVSYHEWLVEE